MATSCFFQLSSSCFSCVSTYIQQRVLLVRYSLTPEFCRRLFRAGHWVPSCFGVELLGVGLFWPQCEDGQAYLWTTRRICHCIFYNVIISWRTIYACQMLMKFIRHFCTRLSPSTNFEPFGWSIWSSGCTRPWPASTWLFVLSVF